VRRGRSAGRVGASVADGRGGFSSPVTLGRTHSSVEPVTAAVSPRGDTLVAWGDIRGAAYPRGGRERILVSRRQPGGHFGVPEVVSPWRSRPVFGSLGVTAAFDASGSATLAWVRPLLNRPRIHDLARVEATSATATGRFEAPVALGPVTQDVQTPALQVAPSGRALLAYAGVDQLKLFERAPGAPRFRTLLPPAGVDLAAAPVLALRDDGAALLAWRTGGIDGDDGGIQLAVRQAPGHFSRARTSVKPPSSASSTGFLILEGGVFAPIDEDNLRLHAILSSTGRFVLVWGSTRHLLFGGAPTAPRVVQGDIDGSLGRPRTIGCPCRSINGVSALIALGQPAVAFTDNLTSGSFSDERATRSGRLHLGVDGPTPATRAPKLSVKASPQVLAWGQPVELRVRCDRPCDLRGIVALRPRRRRRDLLSDRPPPPLGTAALRRPGTGRLRVEPLFERQLAPRRPGRVRVIVRAYAPDSDSFSNRSVRVLLRRRPVKPVFAPLEVRAVRHGRRIDVSWRYPRRADRVFFLVRPRRAIRRGAYPFIAIEKGDGHRRFHTRLRVGRRDVVPFVSVTTIAQHAPDREKTVVVPVFGF
jgi:hypothetical protein